MIQPPAHATSSFNSNRVHGPIMKKSAVKVLKFLTQEI